MVNAETSPVIPDPHAPDPPVASAQPGDVSPAGPDRQPGELFALAASETARGPIMTWRVARVALPIPGASVFDYAIPEPLVPVIEAGMRVNVPLGAGHKAGVCVEIAEVRTAFEPRYLDAMVDEPGKPMFTPHMLELSRWVADYYGGSLGQALNTAVPASVRRKGGRRTIVVVKPNVSVEEGAVIAENLIASPATQKQGRALKTLITFAEDITPSRLASRLGITLSPIRTLARNGLVRYERVPIKTHEVFDPTPEEPAPIHKLNNEQLGAVNALEAAVQRGGFAPFLLWGVTGSGKTEVYIKAIEAALALGKSAIVLVPEIALTPQTQRRFEARFERVALLHSALTDRERHAQWQAVRNGDARVVVGPRSAVFAPAHDLGLIIVDEEHESSYKQENTPRYHARDVAVQRAALLGATVVLGSATPSVETMLNARAKKYGMLRLTRRVENRELPVVDVVDMGIECRDLKRLVIFSRLLVDRLDACIQAGEQAILCLNRRGFNTFVHCTRCGWSLQCPYCAVAMTFHRKLGRAVCHYCYDTREINREMPCPDCGHAPVSYQGVGVEQVEAQLNRDFPELRVARMDSDTMTTRAAYEETLTAFREGELDVLVGTQMIAKGLDFPNVTLVGVVSADSSLHLPDFRARERTFQLIAQVAGRAGRGDRTGTVIVQSFRPDDPAIVLASKHDVERFFEVEVRDRRNGNYPPFCRLINLTAEGRDEHTTEGTLIAIAERLRALRGEPSALAREPAIANAAPELREAVMTAQVLGPAPAPIARLRGKYRFQLLIKATGSRTVRQIVPFVRMQLAPRHTTVSIDVDPMSFL